MDRKLKENIEFGSSILIQSEVLGWTIRINVLSFKKQKKKKSEPFIKKQKHHLKNNGDSRISELF